MINRSINLKKFGLCEPSLKKANLCFYNVKTFAQVQAENKVTATVKFANVKVCLEGFTNIVETKKFVSNSCKVKNQFLDFFTWQVLSKFGLEMDNIKVQSFKPGSGTMVMDILDEAVYYKTVKSLKKLGVVYIKQLLDKKSNKCLDPKGLIPIWFKICAEYLVELDNAINLNRNSRLISTMDANFDSLLDFTELAAMALALECMLKGRFCDVFTNNSAAISMCKDEIGNYRVDFRNKCWMERHRIANIVREKSLPLGNEIADHLANVATLSKIGISSANRARWEIKLAKKYSHFNSGFTSAKTAGLCTYIMKALHGRLLMAEQKKLYNVGYSNMPCIKCGPSSSGLGIDNFGILQKLSELASCNGIHDSADLRWDMILYREALNLYNNAKIATSKIVETMPTAEMRLDYKRNGWSYTDNLDLVDYNWKNRANLLLIFGLYYNAPSLT
ncbi:hypothetical protein G9A89_007284 [Geosiphon pyriformis]|nr:hypothetical protein G9A89_007284 [Geosiphon pyriformis]